MDLWRRNMLLEAKDQSSSANKNKYVAEKQKKDPQVDRVSDVYALTPEDFKYENKLYKYIRYSKNADAENLKVILDIDIDRN